jgi:hypothetical protein
MSKLYVDNIASKTGGNTAATINTSGFFIPKLNIVQTVKTDTFVQNPSSAWIDITGLSVNITPTLSTSKILVQISIVGGGLNAVNEAKFRLVRDSTVIYAGDPAGNRALGFAAGLAIDSGSTFTSCGTFIDSPNTTSSTTYKIQVYSNNTVYINRTSQDADDANRLRGASSLTVTEIAG